MPTSTVTVTPSATVLPDIPGKVHGIKSTNPWSVQCDDCLKVFSGEWLLAVAKSATFNSRAEIDGLRLCEACWRERGWQDTYEGWAQVPQPH
ncbi:hypothetical protein ACFZA2_02025 [Microbacterium sp. NPDC007973]|uniref:hypothetical protein n=1 Tax=Microbacterium sp. NPDC007973 TaxID=3364182 RepID=UPI0036E71420